MMDCIFCKIANGEIPSYQIDSGNDYLALLDIFPISRGQALIISKKHLSSKFSDLEPEVLNNMMQAAQRISKHMESKLENIDRAIVVVEGLEIDHFHIKIYPAYKGHHGITKGGDKAAEQDLIALQNQLRI